MRTLFALLVVTLLVTDAAWADSPILTANDVGALKLPDVFIVSADYHNGSRSNDGARVAHLDVHGIIGGSMRFEPGYSTGSTAVNGPLPHSVESAAGSNDVG